MQEEYRDIKGYENLYRVSNLGNVYSLISNKVLKPGNRHGYYKVELCKNGKTKNYSIHRLTAETFIPNPNNFPCVNHRNEVKTDNRVENLEWCTHKYNINYGTRTQRMRKTQSKPILQFDLEGNFIAEYPSIHEAAKENNMRINNFPTALKGKCKSLGGYIWKYKE